MLHAAAVNGTDWARLHWWERSCEAVAKELTVLTSFVTGSYRRDTLIAPLAKADIDIVVILDPSYYSADGHANLIDRVKRVLKVTYPTTPEISRDGQAVTISFTDFKVDVANRFGGLLSSLRVKNGMESEPFWVSTIRYLRIIRKVRLA